MSDLIRREDVVEALYQAIRTTLTGTFTDSMSLAIAMANNLPSAEPESKWISVTEALPEDDQVVLCTVKGYLEGENWTIVDCRYKDGIWEICDKTAYGYWVEIIDVLAWMPLPEPWRGE